MIKTILSLVLMVVLSSLAFGIFTAAPSFSQYATLQNYTGTNPSINCSSPNMENNSVHDAQRTDSGSIIIEYRYSPSNPHSGCPMEWRLSFEKGFDPTQKYANVQYDIFTVDDQGKKLSSVAQDRGKTNLFAPIGDDDLKVVLKGTTPLAHTVIAVLGTGPDGSIPDTSLAGVVKFDINTSSNPPKNNTNKHTLEDNVEIARKKVAAEAGNPKLGAGTPYRTTALTPMMPNSMSSSNLGLREGEWVKYKITQLDVSANDPLVEAEFRSAILNMLTPQEIDSNVSTDWIKFTVKKTTGINATLDTTVGLSNGTEKDLGEEIFDPKNYTGSPEAIPIDLKVGDIVPLSMNAKPLAVDKIDTIQVAGKNMEVFELASTTSIYNGGGSVESYQHAFYDKNTGILLINSLSTSVSGSVFSAKADVTLNAVDFSDDLLTSHLNNVESHLSIPQWVKNNAKLWSDGSVSDGDFTQGIQYLIQKGVIIIPSTQLSSNTSHVIPQWVRNSTKLWAERQISDDEFVKGMQYLVQQGIIITK